MYQRFLFFRSIFRFRRHNKFLRQNSYARTSYSILNNMFFDFTSANNCIVSKKNVIIVSCQMTSLKKWKKSEKEEFRTSLNQVIVSLFLSKAFQQFIQTTFIFNLFSNLIRLLKSLSSSYIKFSFWILKTNREISYFFRRCFEFSMIVLIAD